MNRKPIPSTEAELAIMTVAARQHGMVGRRQLVRAGVSPDFIDRQLKAGRLRRVFSGMYQVGPVDAPHARIMAAALACGDGAVVSHRSAAFLWRMMVGRPDDIVDVIVSDHSRRRAGIRAHRDRLRTDEITRHDGVPVTTPARTLFDMARLVQSATRNGSTTVPVTHRDLERAFATALAARIVAREDVLRLLEHHRGGGPLRSLAEPNVTPVLTRSEAEDRLLDLVRRAKLRDPAANTIVEGFEVDFVWRAERLIVEVDGHKYHSSRRSFENDRLRDSVLVAAGYRVMRVTWQQITTEPEALLVRIARALMRGETQAR